MVAEDDYVLLRVRHSSGRVLSTIVPLETQRRLKQTLPRSDIVVMPGLGHYPHLEAPADFLAVVKNFLSRTNRAPREYE